MILWGQFDAPYAINFLYIQLLSHWCALSVCERQAVLKAQLLLPRHNNDPWPSRMLVLISISISIWESFSREEKTQNSMKSGAAHTAESAREWMMRTQSSRARVKMIFYIFFSSSFEWWISLKWNRRGCIKWFLPWPPLLFTLTLCCVCFCVHSSAPSSHAQRRRLDVFHAKLTFLFLASSHIFFCYLICSTLVNSNRFSLPTLSFKLISIYSSSLHPCVVCNFFFSFFSTSPPSSLFSIVMGAFSLLQPQRELTVERKLRWHNTLLHSLSNWSKTKKRKTQANQFWCEIKCFVISARTSSEMAVQSESRHKLFHLNSVRERGKLVWQHWFKLSYRYEVSTLMKISWELASFSSSSFFDDDIACRTQKYHRLLPMEIRWAGAKINVIMGNNSKHTNKHKQRALSLKWIKSKTEKSSRRWWQCWWDFPWFLCFCVLLRSMANKFNFCSLWIPFRPTIGKISILIPPISCCCWCFVGGYRLSSSSTTFLHFFSSLEHTPKKNTNRAKKETENEMTAF